MIYPELPSIDLFQRTTANADTMGHFCGQAFVRIHSNFVVGPRMVDNAIASRQDGI